MLPVRETLEPLGFQVEWEEGARVVTLKRDNWKVEFQVGSNEVAYYGLTYQMNAQVQLSQGNTMVPVQMLREFLAADVNLMELEQQTRLYIRISPDICVKTCPIPNLKRGAKG